MKTKEEAQKRLSEIKNEEQELLVIINRKDNILDQLNTFEDACRLDGVNPNDILPYPIWKTDRENYLNNVAMLDQIIKVARQGWVPDWDKDDYKYEPIFNLRAGFVFSGTVYDWATTGAAGGSRLVFPTEEMAETIATRFLAIYKVIKTYPH